MDTKTFSYPIIIKESYLDTFGHVNNATYLTLFEEARWDFITKNGYGLKRIKETGLGPTILEIKLQFLKEIRLREEITIETKVIFYKNKIGKIAQQMIRNGEICCEAEFTVGLFSLKERKLVLPTPEWLLAVGIEESSQ
ncbi:MAG: acyl-CoA thioesterase [Gammaproteobacteria bacterium]|nr:acyl-CoA thioesterase [Gammaproteobacteria bacterium]